MTAAVGPRILGIGGSLRPASLALAALRSGLDGVARAGATPVLVDVRDLALPLYDDRSAPETYPPNVHRLLDEVRRCDGLIVGSPVYHGTMSGAIKNVLDFLELLAGDDPPWLAGKPVGLITVSGGRPRSDAIVSLEIACRALHAWVVPVAVAISEDSFEDGALNDERVTARLELLATALVGAAGGRRS